MPQGFAQFRGAESLQNIHPLIVHYPIAFLTASVPIYLLAWILRRELLETFGLWLLGLGTLSAAAAAYTGWSGSEGVMIAPSVREHVLEYHKWLMLAVLGLSTILTGWALISRPMPRKGRAVFMVGLVLMTLVLAKGADYG